MLDHTAGKMQIHKKKDLTIAGNEIKSSRNLTDPAFPGFKETMSAYIVDRHHVAYLAKIAATKTPHLRHWFNSTRGIVEPEKLALALYIATLKPKA